VAVSHIILLLNLAVLRRWYHYSSLLFSSPGFALQTNTSAEVSSLVARYEEFGLLKAVNGIIKPVNARMGHLPLFKYKERIQQWGRCCSRELSLQDGPIAQECGNGGGKLPESFGLVLPGNEKVQKRIRELFHFYNSWFHGLVADTRLKSDKSRFTRSEVCDRVVSMSGWCVSNDVSVGVSVKSLMFESRNSLTYAT
jgi:hypothetical protein